MFRAKLIGDSQYYRLRWNVPIIIFSSIIGGTFASWLDDMSGWSSVALLVVLGIAGIYAYKWSKKFKEIIETVSIEMNERQLRLISHKNHKTSKFDMDQLDQILVKSEYKQMVSEGTV